MCLSRGCAAHLVLRRREPRDQCSTRGKTNPLPKPSEPILSVLEPLFFSLRAVLPPLLSLIHHGERDGRERTSAAARVEADSWREEGPGKGKCWPPTGSGGCGGRATAACGASTRLAAAPMEGKGLTSACRQEKLGGLIDWGDGGHPSFFDRSMIWTGPRQRGRGAEASDPLQPRTSTVTCGEYKKNFEDEFDQEDQGKEKMRSNPNTGRFLAPNLREEKGMCCCT